MPIQIYRNQPTSHRFDLIRFQPSFPPSVTPSPQPSYPPTNKIRYNSFGFRFRYRNRYDYQTVHQPIDRFIIFASLISIDPFLGRSSNNRQKATQQQKTKSRYNSRSTSSYHILHTWYFNNLRLLQVLLSFPSKQRPGQPQQKIASLKSRRQRSPAPPPKTQTQNKRLRRRPRSVFRQPAPLSPLPLLTPPPPLRNNLSVAGFVIRNGTACLLPSPRPPFSLPPPCLLPLVA